MTTPAELRNRLKAIPFVPFRLRTSFNETADIVRPDGAMVLTTRIVVGIAYLPGDSVFDEFQEISIANICSVGDLI